MAGASALHRHTPVLAVQDARGLVLRQVAWCRTVAEQAAARRVSLTRHDLAGQVRRQWDPRLFERPDAAPGQRSLASLSGRPLLDESADAGWQLTLPGDAGQAAESWDSRGSHWHTLFDERLRPTQVRETAEGQPARVGTCFTYATEAGSNCRGRLIRQDDDAGSRLVSGYSLGGLECGEIRHFLATLELPDWPEALADRNALLEPGDGAPTRFSYDPLGQLLEQADALGNRQAFRFNLAGEQVESRLVTEDGAEHLLLTEARYNAFGQIESQTAGNGVVSHCEYELSTGRLSHLSASRPGRSTLQDLHYSYDPAGNVLKIEDHSQPVTYFANQRVEPVSTFVYDSLYQLTEATGREALGALIGPQLPELAPNPGDTSKLLNYRQHYAYDASGNLVELRHVGQQSYTRAVSVAEQSNHAVPSPGDPLTAFDANGNLLQLVPGQPLQWNARNQLHCTRQVARERSENDEEHYRYGSNGLRVRKIVTRVIAGRVQHSDTRYLPGLELHNQPNEHLAVVTTQAGRCAVRCLLWRGGPPECIANPQMRYSLDDVHDRSGLELDDAANIISHEGYYPFGGTAWWAANSAIEASYKTRRYSGKERDSTGLYYYGLRYYAPWLMRWINPDPSGDVDGLNRYLLVLNNPVTLRDEWGLMNTPREGSGTTVKKTLEERLEFIEMEFDHEFSDPYTMKSVYIGEDGERNVFENEFTEDLWTFKWNFKKSPLNIFASDVVIYQSRQVAEEYEFEGTRPKRIKHERVVNRETLRELVGFENGSIQLMRAFLERTPNGKWTQHSLAIIGMQAVRVTMEPTSWGQDELLSAHIYVDLEPLQGTAPSSEKPTTNVITALAEASPDPGGTELQQLVHATSATTRVRRLSGEQHRMSS